MFKKNVIKNPEGRIINIQGYDKITHKFHKTHSINF
jgi:hypothetical protein